MPVNKVLTILAALLKFLRRLFRQREAEEFQNEAREIEKDPAGWFDDHFNGPDRNTNSLRNGANLPKDAHETRKTGTAEPPKDY